MSKLPQFKLESYLATREFKAPYMLCASDTESYLMSELLNLADQECLKLWNNLSLTYTELFGMPLLLEEIAKSYEKHIASKNILCFAGAEEGIYCMCHSILEKEDHAIVITPCYQSLKAIPSSLCKVSKIQLFHENNWELDISKIKSTIQPNTKLIIINYPHNPTGAMLTKIQQKELVDIARENNLWIFSDEVYRLLELEPNDQLPMIADEYEKGLSLGVMSKAFGLAGLRIGWVATQNTEILNKMSNIKSYLSICNSAPSEIISIIALRNKNKILDRNLKIIKKNIMLLNVFFENNQSVFEWLTPKSGCTSFPKLKPPISAYDFSENLLKTKGVVMLPSTVYDYGDSHVRIGFGRKNLPIALNHLQDFISSNFDFT